MAESDLSSDMEPEPCSLQRPAKRSKKPSGKRSKVSSHRSHSQHQGKGADKAAQRRHNALERQWDKARWAAEVGLDAGAHTRGASVSASENPASPGSPASSTGPAEQDDGRCAAPQRLSKRVSQSLPDVSGVGLQSFHRPPRTLPEATYTPTAAGLRDQGGLPLATPMDMQAFLSSTFSSFLATGLHQATQPLQHAWSGQSVHQNVPTSSSLSNRRDANTSQTDSDQGKECPEDIELSEDEGMAPDTPSFMGLFRPSMFKSLLHKARFTANLGAPGVDSSPAPPAVGPHDALFQSAKTNKDVIPCPRLFLDVLQYPWGQPGSLTAPSTLDKKLFCPAPELEELLTLPAVDAPVAALSSNSVISTDSLDGLKTEDRQAELAFRKSHQAVA